MVKSIIIFWKIKAMLQINIYALMTNLKCTKGYSNSPGFVQLFFVKKYDISSMFHVGYLASETILKTNFFIKLLRLFSLRTKNGLRCPALQGGTTRGSLWKHSSHHYKRLLIAQNIQ